MNNPIAFLWKKRISFLAKLYYRFISFQIDWVILLYLGALMAITGDSFLLFVQQTLTFSPTLFWNVISIGAILFLMSGQLNGYLKGADQLFLSPLNLSGKKFLKYSHRLSAAIHGMVWTVFTIILYLLANDGNNGNIYLVLWFSGLILKLGVLNLKFFIYNKRGKWTRRILDLLLYLIVSTSLGYVIFSSSLASLNLWQIGVSLIVLLVFLISSFLIKKRVDIDWERLITDETDSRARNLSLLLGYITTEKKSSRKKTFSYFSGRKLLPYSKKGALLLLYFRMLQRGKGKLTLLLQIMIAIFVGIYVSSRTFEVQEPALVKWVGMVFIIFLAYVLGDFLVSIWMNLKYDPWFRIYPYSSKDKRSALELGPNIVLSICLLLIVGFIIAFIGSIFHPIIDLVGVYILGTMIIKLQVGRLLIKMGI